jgi:hypothetical protein
MNNPITASCITIDLEKQIGFRANRLIHVRKDTALEGLTMLASLRLEHMFAAAETTHAVLREQVQ